MRVKQIISALALCASTLAFAAAAPAYEVQTEATPPDPVNDGVVYGVEEPEDEPVGAAGVAVGVCAIIAIGGAAGYAIHQRKKLDNAVDQPKHLAGTSHKMAVSDIFKDRECDVRIEDNPNGTADLIITSKDAYWTDTFQSHEHALEFARQYGFM